MKYQKIHPANREELIGIFQFTLHEVQCAAHYLDIDLSKYILKMSEIIAIIGIFNCAKTSGFCPMPEIAPSVRIVQIIRYLNQHGHLPSRRWVKKHTQPEVLELPKHFREGMC
jgi:hypothetical protein